MSRELDRYLAEHAPGSTYEFGLAARVAAAPPGGVVALPPGTYVSALSLGKSVTIRGEPGGRRPVLLGTPASSALEIEGDELEVVLECLVIRGAGGDHGAVAALGAGGRLVLRDCAILACRQNELGPAAGGLSARGGEVLLERCTFVGNRGLAGGAVAVRGDARLEARSCLFVGNRGLSGGGACWAEDGARVRFVNCTLLLNEGDDVLAGAAVHLTGTTGRQARGELVNCVVASRRPELATFGHAQPPYSGRATVRSSIVPEDARSYELASLDATTIVGAPALASDDWPFAIARGKPGSDDGDLSAWPKPEEALDVFGAPLAREGRIARGAVAPR